MHSCSMMSDCTGLRKGFGREDNQHGLTIGRMTIDMIVHGRLSICKYASGGVPSI